MNPQKISRILAAWMLSWAMLVPPAGAQQLPEVEKPHGIFLYRPYKPNYVAPITLHNSSRIRSLLRSGNLYLTVQDAIALAIENNLNLEIARYTLPSADWNVERQEAGGPIRGVGGATANVGAVNAGTGVLGAIQSAGVATGNGGGGGGGGSAQNVQQIGPVVVKFDPAFTGSTTLSHITTPLSNVQIAQTSALVDSTRIYSQTLSQGLETGGTVAYSNYAYSLRENSPTDALNPVFTPYMTVSFQQPLLQGFGTGLNTRAIRVARNGLVVAREQFRNTLETLVANIASQYWSLVSANAELKARQQGLANAQKFLADTLREIDAGALPRVQQSRAEAEVASRRQDMILAQVTVRQQETVLKEQLVRQLEPEIDAAPIVPLDAIQVPDRDDIPSLRTLVGRAMEYRPDVAVNKINEENAAISAMGTQNGLLPNLIPFGYMRNRSASGTPNGQAGARVNQYFVGGYGNALGQIFRRNFPSEQAGVFLGGLQPRNRQSQADYGIEQLQLQVSTITNQKFNNDIVVAVSNQMVAVQQARVRYNAAINTRKLQEQLLAADQERFAYGTTTLNAIIADQRALVTAQVSEIQSLDAYGRARDGLYQVLGQTLDQYNISLDEGMKGRVNRESHIPDVIEQQQQSRNRQK